MCVCVCVCVCVCARACVPSTCSHLSVKHGSHPLRTRSHRHRDTKYIFLSPLQLELLKYVHPDVCLHGTANFPPTPPLCHGLSRHTQGRVLMTPVLLDAVRGAWAGLRSGSFLQLPNIESLLSTALLTAPLVTKTCMPRQKVLLGLPAKFQTWTLAVWLWPGPESQLSKFSYRGAPSSTTPCPSPPPDTAGMPG